MESKQKNNRINQEEFLAELKDKIIQTYGDYGIACFNRGYNIKKADLNDGILLLMVRRGCEEMVMSVVPLITSVAQKRSQILILHLSGTMRSSLRHWKQYYLKELRRTIGQKSATLS